MIRRPAVKILACSAMGLATLAGCTSDRTDDAADQDVATEVPIEAATVPPERQTPFCEAMIDLSARLVSDPPDDVEGAIVEVYREILPEVPAEILDDFTAVLAAVESGRPLPTTSPQSIPTSGTTPVSGEPGSELTDGFDAEPFELSTPAERINDYVSFACRDTGNNPGPPPTQPLEEG